MVMVLYSQVALLCLVLVFCTVQRHAVAASTSKLGYIGIANPGVPPSAYQLQSDPDYLAMCRCVSPPNPLKPNIVEFVISICNTGCGNPAFICSEASGCAADQRNCDQCACKPYQFGGNTMTFAECQEQCCRVGMHIPGNTLETDASLGTGCNINGMEAWVQPGARTKCPTTPTSTDAVSKSVSFETASPSFSGSNTTTKSSNISLTHTIPKKSIEELKQDRPECVPLADPLKLEATSTEEPTAIESYNKESQEAALAIEADDSNASYDFVADLSSMMSKGKVFNVSAATIRSTGLTIQVSLRSCHTFRKTYGLAPHPNFTVSSNKHTMSLLQLNQLLPERAIIQQKVTGMGRVLKIEISPLESYFPPGDDGILFLDEQDAGSGGMFDPAPKLDDPLDVSFAASVAPLNNASTPGGNQPLHQQTVVKYGYPYFGALPPLSLNIITEKRPRRDPMTTLIINSGSGGVGVAGAALGSPAMAGAAQRQALLSNVAECPRSVETEPLSHDNHPLQFPLGNGPFKYHLGSIAGNAAIIVGLIVLHFFLALLVAWISKISLSTAIEWTRFPCRTLPVSTILLQGWLTSAMLVAMSGTEAVQIATTIAAAAIGLVLCLAIAISLRGGKETFEARMSLKDTKNRSCLAWLTMNVGRWVPKNPQRERFVRMCGVLFEDFHAHSRHFFLIDMLVMVVSSYVMALIPNNFARCEIVFISVVSLFILYALVIIITRPFLAGINNFLFGATSFLQAASAICLFYAYRDNQQEMMEISEFFNFAVLALQFVNLIFSIGKSVQDWMNGDLQPDKAMRQESELSARRQAEMARKLGLGFLGVLPYEPPRSEE